MGLSLDVYTILWDFKESRKIGANGVSDRFEFGSLGDDGAVEIDDAEAGVVDASDFTAWVVAYNGGNIAADQNCDGLITPADFTAWVANYNLCTP